MAGGQHRISGGRPVQSCCLSHQEGAARLGIPKGSLSNWVQAAKRQGERVGGSAAMPPTVAELQAEVARLRKELARTEMERDIVRKAAA